MTMIDCFLLLGWGRGGSYARLGGRWRFGFFKNVTVILRFPIKGWN